MEISMKPDCVLLFVIEDTSEDLLPSRMSRRACSVLFEWCSSAERTPGNYTGWGHPHHRCILNY